MLLVRESETLHFKVAITNMLHNTVDSGNSKRLNSEQSLISEHFW